MIKFRGDLNDGRKLVGLGIDRGNVERLESGKPLQIALDEYGAPGVDLFICFGETQDLLFAQLQHLITAETHFRDETNKVKH